ncbi:PAS domain-containing protein [Thiohalorhabdus sp.]|uniref:PAS domain-containing protein n=1 Tax=Thiohalorhabdus sp. TaxID=3094134 RepID=UPI002FC36426
MPEYSHFQKLADGLPEPLMLVSQEGYVETVNRAAAAHLGQSADALAYRPLTELIANPPDQIHDYLRRWARTRNPLPATLRFKETAKELRGWRCQGFRFGGVAERGWARVVIR